MLRDCFHLRAEPFGLTPDLRFLFNAVEFERVGYEMLSTCRQDGAVAVLSAPPGCGKTLLLRWLVSQTGGQVRSEVVWAPDFGLADLHSLLMLGAEGADRKEQPGSSPDPKDVALRPVLLLDEADKLSDEVLSGFASILDSQRDCLLFRGVVLAGDEEFSVRLDSLGFGALKKGWSLSPLSPEQVYAYIHYRLQVADYRGGTLFSAAAIDRLAVLSQGVPRVINSLCNRALIALCVGGEQQVSVDLLDSVSGDETFAATTLALAPGSDTRSSSRGAAQPAISDQSPAVREDRSAMFEEPAADDCVMGVVAASSRPMATPITPRRRKRQIRRRLFIGTAGMTAAGAVFAAVALVVGVREGLETTEEVPLELPSRPLISRDDNDARDGVLGRTAHAEIRAPIMVAKSDPPTIASASANVAASIEQTPPETDGGATATASNKVPRAQFTSGISSREPVDMAGPVVSADEIRRLYFFTELKGLRGETVTHRWLHEGKIMAEIRFRVRGSAWRAFSRKDLTLAMTGPWQVVVTDSKDNTLATAHFRYEAP